MPRAANKLPANYPALLEDIKSRIRSSQIKAALSVNRELIEKEQNRCRICIKNFQASGRCSRVQIYQSTAQEISG